MRRVLFVLLTILAICSCSKKQVWDDSHIPTAYHDGVFSFDYEGTRYHQYSYRAENYGPYVYCAIALYHPKKDTLIIYGRVKGDDISELIFTIPFEKVIETGKSFSLSKENVTLLSRGLSVNEVFIRIDNFFDNNEYVSGTFSAMMEDENHRQSKIENGLFRMNAKSNDHNFFEKDIEGNMIYVGPTGITESGGLW